MSGATFAATASAAAAPAPAPVRGGHPSDTRSEDGSDPTKAIRLNGVALSLPYSVIVGVASDVRSEDGAFWMAAMIAQDDATAAVERAFEQCDAVANHWNRDSELTRRVNLWNGHAAPSSPAARCASAGPLSSDLNALLDLARQAHDATGGAYDPTVLVASQLWRAALAGKEGPAREPTPAELGRAADAMGWGAALMRRADGGGWARRDDAHADACVGLDSIAKGWGVDLVVRELRAAGFADGLVEWGGDIRCFGHNARRQRRWRLTVPSPPPLAEVFDVWRRIESASAEVPRAVRAASLPKGARFRPHSTNALPSPPPIDPPALESILLGKGPSDVDVGGAESTESALACSGDWGDVMKWGHGHLFDARRALPRPYVLGAAPPSSEGGAPEAIGEGAASARGAAASGDAASAAELECPVAMAAVTATTCAVADAVATCLACMRTVREARAWLKTSAADNSPLLEGVHRYWIAGRGASSSGRQVVVKGHLQKEARRSASADALKAALRSVPKGVALLAAAEGRTLTPLRVRRAARERASTSAAMERALKDAEEKVAARARGDGDGDGEWLDDLLHAHLPSSSWRVRAITLTSLTACSLAPVPLVTFNLDARTAAASALVRQAKERATFTLHLLAQSAEHACCAAWGARGGDDAALSPSDERVAWRTMLSAESGTSAAVHAAANLHSTPAGEFPIVRAVSQHTGATILLCAVNAMYAAGDHVIVVAEVIDVLPCASPNGRGALVWHERAFRKWNSGGALLEGRHT